MTAGVVGEAVGPLAQQRLHERLGLAIGLWSSGAGVTAADAKLGAGSSPGVGAVAIAVVREHALDRDPALAVPGLCPAQEGHAVGGALAGEQLGVGQTRVVVDREVEVLPAGVPVTAAGSGPSARLPKVQKRPSFLMSTWTSSPGRARS